MPVPPQRAATQGSALLYLNKCVGGCTIKVGADDATNDQSMLATMPANLPEFAWKPGEWEGIVACMKEVYSPYNVAITDTRPTGAIYNEVIVAGGHLDIGVPDSCGYAPGAGDCSVLNNAVAFVFVDEAQPAGCYDGYTQSEAGNSVHAMCWLTAQESAHTYGLDHAFGTFDSGQSTCNDPMTYSFACGGEKFFRNDFAKCNGNDGNVKPACGFTEQCGTRQNSHLKLLDDFGPATPTTRSPVAMVVAPADGSSVMTGTQVTATASAQRGVATVELWINGFKWGDPVKGVAFGPDGQPEAPYTIAIPDGVPDSKLDIVMKAFDDILIEGDSQTVTVMKGKAGGCDPTVMNADGTVDTCLNGQKCDAGKCAWDPPSGEFGDACTYDQFCLNSTCRGTATQKICTHDCDMTIKDSCPTGFECIPDGPSDGICFVPQPSGGCCSAGSEGGVGGHGALALATLAAIGRRRRR